MDGVWWCAVVAWGAGRGVGGGGRAEQEGEGRSNGDMGGGGCGWSRTEENLQTATDKRKLCVLIDCVNHSTDPPWTLHRYHQDSVIPGLLQHSNESAAAVLAGDLTRARRC